MKSGTKIALGVITSLTVMAFIPTYDLILKDKIDSVDVVVVKPGTEIAKNEEITHKHLTVEARRKQDLLSDAILAKDMDKIFGYEAAHTLVGNQMVSEKMIDFDRMIPSETEGEAIRPITEDMIFAMPGSLRRKDMIDIYLVDSRVFQDNSNNNSEHGTVVTPTTVSKPTMSGTPFLKNVRVVYVKDDANKEVQNDSEQKEKGVRLNATANEKELELLMKEEDFQQLMKEIIQNEKKLYITYN